MCPSVSGFFWFVAAINIALLRKYFKKLFRKYFRKYSKDICRFYKVCSCLCCNRARVGRLCYFTWKKFMANLFYIPKNYLKQCIIEHSRRKYKIKYEHNIQKTLTILVKCIFLNPCIASKFSFTTFIGSKFKEENLIPLVTRALETVLKPYSGRKGKNTTIHYNFMILLL